MWLTTVLFGALSMPALSSPADSIQALLSRGPVDWSAAPAEYRRLLYMNRNEAPAFPDDADSLLNVRNWPATKFFDGEPHDLKFASGQHDVVDGLVCCLSSIRPGWNYSTHYVRRSADLGSKKNPLPTLEITGGPSYRWRSDSTLAAREYVTPEKWETWYYDSSGVLIHYEFMLRQSLRRLGESVSVWFSREGTLIAFAVDRDAYWMGRRETIGAMFHYLGEYYRWPRYR